MSPGRGVLHQNPFILEKNSARRLPQLGSIIYKVYLNSMLFRVTAIVFVHFNSMQKFNGCWLLIKFPRFLPKFEYFETQLVP
jgi:hypothetical protein